MTSDNVAQAANMLQECIKKLNDNKEHYVLHPGKDFSRVRCVTFEDVIRFVLCLQGTAVYNEMIRFCQEGNIGEMTLSAMIQQRSKINSSAFRDLLNSFIAFLSIDSLPTYHGYQILACDGSDINRPEDQNDASFLPLDNHPKGGYNQTHLSVLYDVMHRFYLDAEVQPKKRMDERDALLKMLKRFSLTGKSILTLDRGYESYNVIETLNRKENMYYCIRVKNNGLRDITALPKEELDRDLQVVVTTTQKKEDIKYNRVIIHVDKRSKNGKKYSENTILSHWDYESPCPIRFRAVRFQLDSGEWETLITNLPRSEFSLLALKDLYHMRWEIETSFRDLKYTIGLVHLHSRKPDLIMQEIYASLLMFNFCNKIAAEAYEYSSVKAVEQKENSNSNSDTLNNTQQHVPICADKLEQEYVNIIPFKRLGFSAQGKEMDHDNSSGVPPLKRRKYEYVIRFTSCVLLCKSYLRKKLAFDGAFLRLVGKHIIAKRPGRSDSRHTKPKSFASFNYWIA